MNISLAAAGCCQRFRRAAYRQDYSRVCPYQYSIGNFVPQNPAGSGGLRGGKARTAAKLQATGYLKRSKNKTQSFRLGCFFTIVFR